VIDPPPGSALRRGGENAESVGRRASGEELNEPASSRFEGSSDARAWTVSMTNQ
jgi:hypothetical protein